MPPSVLENYHVEQQQPSPRSSNLSTVFMTIFSPRSVNSLSVDIMADVRRGQPNFIIESCNVINKIRKEEGKE